LFEGRAGKFCTVTGVVEVTGHGGGGRYISSSFSRKVVQLGILFERGYNEVDEEVREAYGRPPAVERLTKDQKKMVEAGREMEKQDRKQRKGWVEVTRLGKDALVKMERRSSPYGLPHGRVSTVVDAPSDQVLSWLIHYTSYDRSRDDSDACRFVMFR